MLSQVNIAEGIKKEAILEGEGQAAKILMESKSLCESLNSIAFSINHNKEQGGGQALKLRLSEQYIEAFNNILSKSNVLMVPEGASQGVTSPSNVASVI